MGYAHTVTVALPYATAVTRIKELLGEQGFGILTEIDLRATFEAKLGPDSAAALGDYLILGACNPVLAQKGLTAEPELGLLLPCNVVVRRPADSAVTVVETIDPNTMVQLSEAPAIQAVADAANSRLLAALDGLTDTAA